MNTYFFFWLTVALATACLELGHPGLFYFLSCAGGAVFAALSTLYGIEFEYQILIFFFMTICSIFAIRYLLMNRLVTHAQYHSNTQALHGQHVYVMQEIFPNKAGTVKIGSEIWVARSTTDAEILRVGQLVEVVRVVGAHVKVRKIQ